MGLALGVTGAIVGGVLFGLGAQAQATVGTQPGALQLNPTSGPTSRTPSWSTTDACPGGFQGSAVLEAVATDGTTFQVSPTVTGSAPQISGSLEASMGEIQSLGGFADDNTSCQEFVVVCFSSPNLQGISQAYQDSFAFTSAHGTSYTTSAMSIMRIATLRSGQIPRLDGGRNKARPERADRSASLSRRAPASSSVRRLISDQRGAAVVGSSNSSDLGARLAFVKPTR